jgi:hypothetical protein
MMEDEVGWMGVEKKKRVEWGGEGAEGVDVFE